MTSADPNKNTTVNTKAGVPTSKSLAKEYLAPIITIPVFVRMVENRNPGSNIFGTPTVFLIKIPKRMARIKDFSVRYSLKNTKLNPLHVKIQCDENIQWYSPSLVDLNYPGKTLTNLRINKKASGKIIVSINDNDVYSKAINATTYTNIKIPRLDYPISKNDTINIRFEI